MRGLLSSCGAQAPHCSDFSCCGAWALEHAGFSSCGAQTSLPCGIWDLPGPEMEVVSLALAGGSLTTGPPEKSSIDSFLLLKKLIIWLH